MPTCPSVSSIMAPGCWTLSGYIYSKTTLVVLYLPDWYQKGVITVADVVSYNKVISYEELCQKFSAHFNYLNYLSVKCKINILLTKFGYALENIILERPFVPANLKYILKSKKGVGTIYRIFHTNFQNDHKMKSRWNQEFEICIDHDSWRMFVLHMF